MCAVLRQQVQRGWRGYCRSRRQLHFILQDDDQYSQGSCVGGGVGKITHTPEPQIIYMFSLRDSKQTKNLGVSPIQPHRGPNQGSFHSCLKFSAFLINKSLFLSKNKLANVQLFAFKCGFFTGVSSYVRSLEHTHFVNINTLFDVCFYAYCRPQKLAFYPQVLKFNYIRFYTEIES